MYLSEAASYSETPRWFNPLSLALLRMWQDVVTDTPRVSTFLAFRRGGSRKRKGEAHPGDVYSPQIQVLTEVEPQVGSYRQLGVKAAL